MIKVLNLYAGIGGNRKLWQDVEVTAIEIVPEIAKIYQDFFPNDKVIITDAHQYLLEHFKEFDFIWSSPPCPTHSRTNYFLKARGVYRYPDMKLYEEIIFLQNFFNGRYCIENVVSYYNPLIKPKQIGRHYFWVNFPLTPIRQPKISIGKMCGKNQTACKKPLGERNSLNSELGLHIFKQAFKEQSLKLAI